jgi:hypothetical protein
LAGSTSEHAEGLVRHFSDRFRIIKIDNILVDIQKAITDLADQLSETNNFVLAPVDPADDILGQRIMILDDTRRNRDIAIAQLG